MDHAPLPERPILQAVQLSRDTEIALQSLEQGQWLTDTVIDRYMTHLNSLSTNSVYLPTHFFTRLYDYIHDTITLHPDLHEIHGPTLLQRTDVYVPIGRTNHWAGIRIQPRTRTITYLDSYYSGGLKYLQGMAEYLEDFERTLGVTAVRP